MKVPLQNFIAEANLTLHKKLIKLTNGHHKTTYGNHDSSHFNKFKDYCSPIAKTKSNCRLGTKEDRDLACL